MDRIIFGLMVYTVLLPCVDCNQVKVMGLMGESIFLKAKIPPGFHVRETIWRTLSPSEELVAVSFRGTPEILYQSRFYGRTHLHETINLEINPVDLGDTGVFSVLLVNTTGEMEMQEFHLVVYGTVNRIKRTIYDEISAPTIQVFAEETQSNDPARQCTLFLACTAISKTNVTYNWTRPESKTLVGGKHSVLENGRVLWIQLDPREEPGAKYICTAANKLTSKSAATDAQEYCRKGSGDTTEPSYDYKSVLLVAVPLASFLLSTGAISFAYSKWRTDTL